VENDITCRSRIENRRYLLFKLLIVYHHQEFGRSCNVTNSNGEVGSFNPGGGMLEYLYSRVMIFFASAALIGIVLSASVGQIDNLSRSYAEELSSKIAGMIRVAEGIDADIFRHEFPVDERGMYPKLKIWIFSTRIIVENGMHTCTKEFGLQVNLRENETPVDRIVAGSQSLIVISSSRDRVNERTEVTIEAISAVQHLYQSSRASQ